MKLLLMSSSSGVEKELSDFIPKLYKKTKVAHIITAAKLVKDHSYLNSASEFFKRAWVWCKNDYFWKLW